MHALTNALKIINAFFANIVPIGDILWTFPQNFSWYANIPIIGSIPFAIYLLLGMGIYFSIRTKFVQFRYFKRGIQVLTKKKKDTTGVSPLAAFMLSAAMRVGPGNIIGVTGAISLGGPGAMFWMWISALLGMASSFVEATLAQIFKEKDGDEYVGGLPYYGQKLAGNKKGVGIALAILFIIYAMLSIPIQTFHVFTAAGTAIASVTGVSTDRTSPLYYALAIILIIGIAIAVFGGIKRVTAVTDRMVPVMAVLYATVIVGLFIANIHLFPAFIQAVVIGAFKPDAIFGGAFGTVLAQGIKRGLLSNEAGQGTITMSAAISEQDHPVEQGFVQSIGVFLDTIIICTLSGFIVCGAHIWTNSAYNWEVLKDSKIEEIKSITPNILIDFHAEATAEKICFGKWASELGVSCVFGTHTHVQTADEQIFNNKTAYITDAGFCGAKNSVIGMEYEASFKKLSLNLPTRNSIVKKGVAIANGVIATVDMMTGCAIKISRLKFIKKYNNEDNNMNKES